MWLGLIMHTIAQETTARRLLQTYGPPRNLVTNGGFEVWQGGPGPFAGSGALTADMWRVTQSAGVPSTSRISSTIGSKGYSMQIVSAAGAGQWTQAYQHVKDHAVVVPFIGKRLHLTAVVKGTVANKVYIQLYDGVQIINSGKNLTTGEETLSVSLLISTGATLVQVGIVVDENTTAEINDVMLVD